MEEAMGGYRLLRINAKVPEELYHDLEEYMRIMGIDNNAELIRHLIRYYVSPFVRLHRYGVRLTGAPQPPVRGEENGEAGSGV